ncbi:DUF3908 family protein [Sporosarcina obsidiansis]|uniref:DUF3908 family protein n=1 Tax=Sporosarcina obsidiansis TaxID=2660748 RepID=UPI001890B829|nr:DUF3908 family protein [Sporosarcina obsidiansis]
MYEITYQEFLKEFRGIGFMNTSVEDQQYSLSDLINEDEIHLFYPKNFLFKEKSLEEAKLLFLMKNKIRIASFLEEGYISIEDRSLKSIKKLIISHKNRISSVLTIYFDDGDTFVLDSLNDSEHHKHKLQKKIEEIYKYIQEVIGN